MPRYDPTNHPLLSPAAKALDEPTLAAQADRAESLLGIAGTDFEGQDAKDLTLAVVLQVNRYLRLDARGSGDGGDVVAESKGDQSVKYSDDATEAEDSEARAIVARVLAGAAPAPLPRTSTSTPNVFVY